MSILEAVAVDNSGLISPWLGFSIILFSFTLFHVFSKSVKLYGESTSSDSLSTYDFWIWRSFLVSWTHSGFISTWNIICFYLYWNEVTTDLVGYSNLTMYCMVAFTTGYFCYDFTDVYTNAGVRSMWEVLLHHCGVIGIFMYNLVTSKCLGYSMVALIVELNTLFLHSRKLLQKHPVPYDHWLYRIIVWANLFTFVFCRFLPLGVLCHGIYVLTISGVVSVAYLIVLSLSIIIMVIIYPILFYRIVKNDVVRYNRSQRKKVQQHGSGSKNNNNNSDNSNHVMPENISQSNGVVYRTKGSS